MKTKKILLGSLLVLATAMTVSNLLGGQDDPQLTDTFKIFLIDGCYYCKHVPPGTPGAMTLEQCERHNPGCM